MTSIHQETDRLGTVERSDGEYVIRFERRLEHPIESVWLALTEPSAIEKWLAAATVFELRDGGTVELHWQNGEDLDGMHATITELEPPHLLEWRGDRHGICRWELRPDDGGCILRFSSTLDAAEVDARAAKDPEHGSPPSLLAGWHVHLDYLDDALDGNAVDWPNWSGDDWSKLYDVYGGERR
jgi:uncharacterized protein YndB with AHSA1/START domain